jgi:hypothetical protein
MMQPLSGNQQARLCLSLFSDGNHPIAIRNLLVVPQSMSLVEVMNYLRERFATMYANLPG